MKNSPYIKVEDMIKILELDSYTKIIELNNKETTLEELKQLSNTTRLYHIDYIDYDEDYIYIPEIDPIGVYPMHVELEIYHISTIE